MRINSLTVPYVDQAMVDDFINMGGSIDKKITEPQYTEYIHQCIAEKRAYQREELRFSKKEKSKIKKDQSEILFEDSNLIVIKPLTYESTMLYGYETMWCVSSTYTDKPYRKYASHSDMFILISKDVNSVYKKIIVSLFESGKFCLFDQDVCIINDAKIMNISGDVTDSNKLGKIQHIFTPELIDIVYDSASIHR